MPVTLHALDQPSEQDRIDLERLLAEQTDPLFRQAYSDWRTEGPVRLWAGYFNRRIAGVILTRDDCIEGMAVRLITQGRGVGSRMLTLLNGHGDWVGHPALPEPVCVLLSRHRMPVKAG